MNHLRTTVQTLLASALALTLGTTPAGAQLPGPPPRGEPGAPAPPLVMGMVEGAVRAVDPTSGTVEVSWGLFGLSGKTLAVMPHTRIEVEGRRTGVADIREGDKVRASYEVLEGQNVADSIDLTPAAESRPVATPQLERIIRETIPMAE